MAFEACRIALEYMMPVMLLSDGYLANGSEPWEIPDINSLKKIISKGSNGDYVIFSHGGPIRAAISFALYASPEDSLPFRIDNISISRLDFIKNSWQIKFINLIP